MNNDDDWYRIIADFTYDWEYWMSPDRKILYCSPSCERITGYAQERFVHTPEMLMRIVHPEDQQIYTNHVMRYFDPAQRGDLEELEFRIVTHKGEEKWIGHACRAVVDKEGKFLGRRVSNRDITDKKQSELMLLQSNQEIKKLNENILQMLKIMSHDMRSPLISVAATLKLLQKGRFGQMDESVLNTVKDLAIRIRQILGIAEDCLGKASAVDTIMKIEKKEIDLRQEVIDAVLDELSNVIEGHKITIDNRLGAIPANTIMIHASKVWLKVVYRNILKNAITYGGPGCTIAFGYEDRGDYYRLNVYNTGVPIPEELRAILFTKFGRVGQEGGEQREGMGMGLFLTKEIITQHGGNIWYEATPGGNNFIFTLPKS